MGRDIIELPASFTHKPPNGYRYEVIRKNASLLAIWSVCNPGYIYNDGADVRCIWGFYKPKSDTYYSPVNSKKVGNTIKFEDTTPYTAMPKPKVKISILDFLQ